MKPNFLTRWSFGRIYEIPSYLRLLFKNDSNLSIKYVFFSAMLARHWKDWWFKFTRWRFVEIVGNLKKSWQSPYTNSHWKILKSLPVYNENSILLILNKNMYYHAFGKRSHCLALRSPWLHFLWDLKLLRFSSYPLLTPALQNPSKPYLKDPKVTKKLEMSRA